MTDRTLNVLGVELDASGPPPLWQVLDLYGPHAALHRPARHHVHVTVRSGRLQPGAAAYPVRTHSGSVQVTPVAADRVWIHGTSHDAHLRVGPDRSVIEVHADTAEPDEPVLMAFTEVLRTQGLLPLHAAVYERAGRGTALLGPSGAGKTTALLSEVLTGARPVTEDFGLFDPASGVLHGLDRGLRCLPDTLGTLRAARPDLPDPPVVRGKALVHWEALGARQCWHAPLDALSVLRRDGPASHLPLAQRVMQVWAATGVPLLPATRAWTAPVIARMARDLHWSERTRDPLLPGQDT